MPEATKLTTTSYVVLGLVAAREPITSYEMKRNVARSIGYFWPFPHSQLYAEPARLVGLGLLEEDVEATGRKRRRFRITETGRQALSRWLAEPASEPTEIRDLGMLKLFFGSQTRREDLVALAAEQPGETYVVGGTQIYAQALPLATHQVLTEVHQSPAGDAHYRSHRNARAHLRDVGGL